jgi:hypothetical protein
MLLVFAGLLVVGLVGFLYFSPSGMTIEKFQNAPAEPAFVPPVLEKPQRAPPLTPAERAAEAAAYAAAQEKRAAAAAAAGPQVGAAPSSTPLAPPPLVPPPIIQVPSFCRDFGYASPDKSIRLYSQKECVSLLGGTWYENGECILKDGRSLSYECRDLNNQATPVKPQQIQAGPSAIQSMMPPPPPPPVLEEPPPPPPIEEPAPIAPTPASSAAALTLTPAQCSALCPVTQETCESMFSCQTRLEPIGVAPMSRTSTPAAVV